jgi:diacylglycerol kinase family enzyme
MRSTMPVIVNAAAGTAANIDVSAVLMKHFEAAGLDVEIMLAKSGDSFVQELRRKVAGKPRAIVVGGGDGTLNAAASILIGTNIALGILPLGTLNHFAKDLRIGVDLGAAARIIAAGNTAAVDVGAVNDRFFINNSSLGLYPKMVQKREMERHRLRRGKWPAFVWAAVAVVRRYPFLDVRVSIDGTALTRRTPFVFIGNNKYEMEGFRIGSRERLDGGELSLYVANRIGRIGLLRLAVRALFHRLDQERDFDTVCAKRIVVETRRDRLHVATDGEISRMTTPLEYRVLPAALSVLVPARHGVE